MAVPTSLLQALSDAGARVEVDAPLHRRVWWRVGGPADAYAELDTLEQLVAARRAAGGTPVFVLGNGSNLLVADRGIRGLVVRLTGDLAEVTAADDHLVCGAGLRNVVLQARAGKHRWSGLDALTGIPGTVGGAVRMNAGSALGEIERAVIDVDVVLPDGEVATLPHAALDFRYRHCALPPGAIVARARLRLTDEPYELGEARMRTFLERRKATQPLDQPSCGSTFRNPPGDTAGRLIDAAGLKGFIVGGAMISPKHANFIVNTGAATAADVLAVIRHAQATVEQQTGICLIPEVEIAGEWPC